ncbi:MULTISPECIES: lytic transglycosylase [unclassified Pseudomonas]|uniref:lytic transglycosylase n=1 Tax=unclassified Pseudomonas TaxID=196821 RepID=UPI00128C5BD7|nr:MULTISPECIES: lytic transglycosylase [unclassified Pseudomonas]MPQ71793.1 lytic transglycosylase [Pseudomonas sp. MWU12-2323]
MKRPIFYCKSWFRAKKRPTDVWAEEQARSAHINKKQYTALVDSADRPYCFLDVTEQVVGVGFLDENLRESLTYAFQRIENGKLFLTMATHREFEGETDKIASGISYVFKQDGTVQMRREFFSPHRLEVSTTSTDVSANYSVVPEFGEYDDFIKIERG